MSAVDSFLTLDVNLTIVAWTAGVEQIFGYAAAEILGKPVFTLVPEDQRQAAVEVLKQNESLPLKLPQEIAILFALTNGHLDDVEVAQVGPFETALLSFMDSNHPEILSKIDEDKDITEETEAVLTEAIEEFKALQ